MTTPLLRRRKPWLFLFASQIVNPVPALGLFLLLSASAASAAAQTKIKFDIPAGDAAQTLKAFAQQAQREIIFSTKSVSGVRTNAVSGEHTAYRPRRAIPSVSVTSTTGTPNASVRSRVTSTSV